MHSVKWPLTRLSSRLLTEIQNRKGRIAGSSLNKGSVQRWLITSHERVVITQACRQMAGLSATNEECVRKEKGKIKDVSWWNDVKKVQSTLNWVNPIQAGLILWQTGIQIFPSRIPRGQSMLLQEPLKLRWPELAKNSQNNGRSF